MSTWNCNRTDNTLSKVAICLINFPPRFYGPYEIQDRVGFLAYKISLPPGAAIHNVFHVSQLKLCPNPPASPSTLPQYLQDVGTPREPEKILEKKMVNRKNKAVTKVLVQWKGSSPEQATWEFYQDFVAKHPDFHTWGQVCSEGGSIVAGQSHNELNRF